MCDEIDTMAAGLAALQARGEVTCTNTSTDILYRLYSIPMIDNIEQYKVSRSPVIFGPSVMNRLMSNVLYYVVVCHNLKLWLSTGYFNLL